MQMIQRKYSFNSTDGNMTVKIDKITKNSQ